jgi:hypothetical protein
MDVVIGRVRRERVKVFRIFLVGVVFFLLSWSGQGWFYWGRYPPSPLYPPGLGLRLAQ